MLPAHLAAQQIFLPHISPNWWKSKQSLNESEYSQYACLLLRLDFDFTRFLALAVSISLLQSDEERRFFD